MKNYVWRTAPSGAEGTATIYVDSFTGSDLYGNGTRANPYKTLRKAKNATTQIICRGVFSEDMAQGEHSKKVAGDYYGAAVFDGQNIYTIYGYTHQNMIIKNVPSGAAVSVYSGSHLLAGVGRAHNANFVGLAASVYGVAGSSVSLHRTGLYFGYIGGSGVKNVVFDSPQFNGSYPLLLGGKQNETFLQDCTVYGVSIESRKKGDNNTGNSVLNTVFGNFAMIGNEARKVTYTNCVFAADVKWYWLTSTNASSGYEELVLTGETSAARQASLLSQLATKGLASNLTPAFVDCVFSDETSAEIFNDAAHGDFTLVPGCDADRGVALFCGALPPAVRVRALDDSTGVAGTWDERSATGCVMVDTNRIVIDTASASLTGSILSKILHINPAQVQLNGIYTELAMMFASMRSAANITAPTGTKYAIGDTLPVGKYVAETTEVIVYNENSIINGDTVVVTETGTTFSCALDADAKLVEIVDPNITDVVYCRCRSTVYARIGQNDYLQRGATYLNDGNESITYHQRQIAPGESFVCMIDNEQFTATTAGYTIAAMFDDTRVPASEWVPAQTMGEYFVSKAAGSIEVDADGIPYGSGNYNSYTGKALNKSAMDREYVQFAIFVNRYGLYNAD